ncbi:hypothetical protein EGCR1_03425 [Enterococcus gilvus]|nr:hypothetical protein EGCR1_03425 [Enterococcus gilvus]
MVNLKKPHSNFSIKKRVPLKKRNSERSKHDKSYFTYSYEMMDHASFPRLARLVGTFIHPSGGFLLFLIIVNIKWINFVLL